MKINKSQLKIELYRFLEYSFGNDFVKRRYLTSCVDRFKKSNCIFIHIPKAAGTSIAVATIGQRAGHFTSLEIQKEMGVKKYNEMFSFSVTREPIQRLISAYNYVKSQGGSHGGVRKEKYFLDNSFRSFESFVNEWLIMEDLKSTNLLFQPQNRFILSEFDEINVNFVGKVEDLGHVEKVLNQNLNTPISIKRMNTTNEGSIVPISSSTRRLIQELYKKDYEHFNY